MTIYDVKNKGYEPLSAEIFISYTVSRTLPDSDQRMLCEMFLESPIGMMVYKRIEAYELQDKIDNCEIFKILIIFNINNPGKAMVILLDFLEYYDRHGKKASMKDMVLEVYPKGFYDEATFIDIIDNYIKTKKVKYAEVYLCE